MFPLLTSLTEAVADGREPAWSSLDLSSLSDEERVQIDELRAVCDIGRCLATLSAGGTLGTLHPAHASHATFSPTTWGSLEIRERVGRGRFGDVYRAWDPAIARPVALKLLRHDHGGPGDERGVVDEGRLMGRVRHPNVATIYGAAHLEGRTGLWMEFIEGRTLEAVLRERGPLPAHEAAQIGIEVCRALAAVHAAGLVHRDVKAQNVMREASGRVVLGDFGTGLDLDNDRSPVLAGTPVYLAPEIFNRQPATPRSDLYSHGVLLYHLVTGSFPVTGRSIVEIRARHARGERARLDVVAPALPHALTAVIERALSPLPSDRFATATEMERALSATLALSDAVADPSTTTRRRRSPARLLVAATVAGVGGAIAFSLWQSGALGLAVPRRATDRAAGGTTQGRSLSRVPAPNDGQFWGRPSPDGHLYTFVAMNGDLGVFDTASGERRVLTNLKKDGGSAFESSTFSPDGLQIAYAWENRDGLREVRIVPTAGGTSRVIRSDREEVTHPLDWSDDGHQLLVRVERRDGARTLGLLAVATGAVTRLDGVDASHNGAAISPDGRHVVFDNSQGGDATERDVFIRSLDRPGAPRPLGSGPRDDFGPLWTTDGGHVLFISDRTGEPSVWAIAVDQGEPRGEPTILHRNIGRVEPYGVSTAGTLFYTLQVGLVDIFSATLDLARGAVVESPKAVAPAQVGSKVNVNWSPDGGRLTYVLLPQAGTGANRTRRLILLDRATGVSRTLNPRLDYYVAPQWSPDERQILVYGWDQQLRRGAYLIDVATGETRAAAIVGGTTPHEIGAVAWGADAQTILIVRQTLGLMTVDLTTGRERPVFMFADEGIRSFTPLPGFGLSPDRRSIAYSAYRRNASGQDETVLRLKHVGGDSRDLVVANVGFQSWTPDGDILYTEFTGELLAQMMSLKIVSAAGGPTRSLGLELKGLRNVKMHPDGRQVTFTAGFPGNELWALENFLSGGQPDR